MGLLAVIVAPEFRATVPVQVEVPLALSIPPPAKTMGMLNDKSPYEESVPLVTVLVMVAVPAPVRLNPSYFQVPPLMLMAARLVTVSGRNTISPDPTLVRV